MSKEQKTTKKNNRGAKFIKSAELRQKRRNISIDDETAKKFEDLADGNLSKGIRKASENI